MKVTTAENGAQVHAHANIRTRASARARAHTHTHTHDERNRPKTAPRCGKKENGLKENLACLVYMYKFWVRTCARASNRQTARRSKTIFKSLSVCLFLSLSVSLSLSVAVSLCLRVCVSVYVYIRHAIVCVSVCLSLSLSLSLFLCLSFPGFEDYQPQQERSLCAAVVPVCRHQSESVTTKLHSCCFGHTGAEGPADDGAAPAPT